MNDDDLDQDNYIMADNLNVQVKTNKNFYLLTLHRVSTVEKAEKKIRKWVAKHCKGEQYESYSIISTTNDDEDY